MCDTESPRVLDVKMLIVITKTSHLKYILNLANVNVKFSNLQRKPHRRRRLILMKNQSIPLLSNFVIHFPENSLKIFLFIHGETIGAC